MAFFAGANTGVFYAIGTLLNPIILEYFPVSVVHFAYEK